MKNRMHKSVVMVAGEASGDQHGAHVIQALRQRLPDIQISGAGGSAMQQAGAHILVDVRELSVMGFTAVFAKAPQILKSLSRLKRQLSKIRPDLLILIDFPDFNLHLAGFAKKIGIPVLYYISPQVWAWRANRIHKIKRRVDHMAVILPFEQSIYQRHAIPASFVGHPLMDAAPQPWDAQSFRPAPEKGATIALLPGSREGEITRLLPEMLKAGQMLSKADPERRFIISRAPTIEAGLIGRYLKQYRLDNAQIVCEPVHDIFRRCDLAVVVSGTASLEAAIFGIPTIIIYATSALNYWLGRMLGSVEHIGLANLIADQRVLPELVQEKSTAPNIAAEVENLLADRDTYRNMQIDLKSIRKQLGRAGASHRVAEIACRLMERRSVI